MHGFEMQASEPGRRFAATGHEPAERSAPPDGDTELEFTQALEKAIAHAARQHLSGALLLISIDNLAMVISGYGHAVSETVVAELIARIRGILAQGDRVERLQRDQIGVILTHSHAEDTEATAFRIINILQNYGRDNFATASLHLLGTIGGVQFPEETNQTYDAMDKAYVALHSLQGSLYRTYASTKREADLCRQQMGLASYLYNAYHEGRLRLAWQPILEVEGHTISHYEALLRIVSASGKISSAGALIPVAEKMGLIGDIDRMVLEMVTQELRANPNINIAFNISNVTLETPQWLELLTRLIEETPHIGPRMMIEITETAIQRDLRSTAYFVASVQALGCQVALDDFGSGYTSFRQLKALSVDLVKIDGVFIKDIATNADSRFFVSTLLDFARGFGLKTVAEFVENGEIARILIDMGVDYLQGYYFGKPENHRSWLKEGEYKAE